MSVFSCFSNPMEVGSISGIKVQPRGNVKAWQKHPKQLPGHSNEAASLSWAGMRKSDPFTVSRAGLLPISLGRKEKPGAEPPKRKRV